MSVEKVFSSLYNEEDDILTVYDPSRKPVEFVQISDFIFLGLNKDESFNTLEISDVSNFLNKMNKEVSKNFLKNLRIAKIKQDIFRGVFLLSLILLTKKGQKIEQSLPPLFVNEYKNPLLKVLSN